MRAYLCVRGGFRSRRILDSRAALEPLRAGDVLSCDAGRIGSHFIGKHIEEGEDRRVLRTTLGGQADWFKNADFYGSSFRVQPDSNRMGLRLQGPPLSVPDRHMISEPVCPGTVQVTSNGQCIILGCDGQTIGGYPKIAHVISADLDKLGQLRPGDTIRFELVEIEVAEKAFRERQHELRNWVTRVRTAAQAVY
jgi:antagonist of KipI